MIHVGGRSFGCRTPLKAIGLGGGGLANLSAADLTLTTATGVIPIGVDVAMGSDIFEGFYLNGEFSADGLTGAATTPGGRYSNLTQSFRHQLTEAERASGTVDLTGEFSDPPTGQPYYMHCWWERQDGRTGPIGTAIHDTVTSVNALNFTPVSAAATSTLYTSNTVTLAGTGTHAAATVVGGNYQLNGGAWTPAGSFTCQIGDTLAVQQTSSSSAATETDVTVTLNGASNTYAVTTGTTAATMFYHASNTSSTGTSLTIAGVSFFTGNRVVVVRYGSSAATGVTIGGFSATKLTDVGGVQIWIDTTSRAAGTADVTVTFGSSTWGSAMALTAANISSTTVSDTTSRTNVNTADPKTFSDTLIVPNPGIGLVAARAAGSSGKTITWNTGTALAQVFNSGSNDYLCVASFAAGTSLTPSFNLGVSGAYGGTGVSWNG